MEPQKKARTRYEDLTKDLKNTHSRLEELAGGLEALAGEISNLRKEIPAAAPVLDENSIVEKVQAQLARNLLPAIENLQNNLKTVAAAVAQLQQSGAVDDNHIQAQVEKIFQQNLSSMQAAIAQQMNEYRSSLPSTPGQPPGPSQTPSWLSLATSLFTGILTAAQANPEGVKAIGSLLRPAPPLESVIMNEMARTLKFADTMNKMQKAVASGEDITKVIQTYATPAKT